MTLPEDIRAARQRDGQLLAKREYKVRSSNNESDKTDYD